MELRQEPLPGDDSVAAALYGPLVLAADLGPAPTDDPMRVIHSGDTVPKNLPAASPLPKVAATQDTDTKQWIQVESPSELKLHLLVAKTKNTISCRCTRFKINVTRSIGKPGIPNSGPSL